MQFKMTPFIFWSGIYNAGLALTLTCPPFYRLLGLIAVPLGLGLGDLTIGLLYMFGLPKELGLSHLALLCDRAG